MCPVQKKHWRFDENGLNHDTLSTRQQRPKPHGGFRRSYSTPINDLYVTLPSLSSVMFCGVLLGFDNRGSFAFWSISHSAALLPPQPTSRPLQPSQQITNPSHTTIMVHVPSFLVGSTFSVMCALAVHEQLSHRSRLSKKWKLRGKK